MITLTDTAVEKLNTLITGNKQLRVLVKGTGCSGMAYHLEYNLMETDQDDSFTVRGIPVIIDKKSQVYVEGAEIDHRKKGLNEGFEFYNPKEKNGGWIHCSYNEKGVNRKQVLVFDGKSYENGLPEMEYTFDKMGNEVIK